MVTLLVLYILDSWGLMGRGNNSRGRKWRRRCGPGAHPSSVHTFGGVQHSMVGQVKKDFLIRCQPPRWVTMVWLQAHGELHPKPAGKNVPAYSEVCPRKKRLGVRQLCWGCIRSRDLEKLVKCGLGVVHGQCGQLLAALVCVCVCVCVWWALTSSLGQLFGVYATTIVGGISQSNPYAARDRKQREGGRDE